MNEKRDNVLKFTVSLFHLIKDIQIQKSIKIQTNEQVQTHPLYLSFSAFFKVKR